MNLNDILHSLDCSGYFGHVVSTEEAIILYNSLLILQNENHFKEVFFWGKIFGSEKDYYIAYGYEKDILYGKVFYYSLNCIDWGLMPKAYRSSSLMVLCVRNHFFAGDPSLIIDILIEKEETLVPAKRKQAELRKLKEEDRLAATVSLIFDEAGIIPRMGIFRRPDGMVINNTAFEGLKSIDAREWSSYLHFRVPTEGCWMLRIGQAEDVAILKSLHWPGLVFYHHLRTPKHGFLYFGHGKRCLDVPFMLSPYQM